jgi:hypothetical protein
MTKSYGGLFAHAKPATDPHPLEGVIRKIFADWEKRGATDLDLVHITLGMGACTHPKCGWDAYRTVAEDVLGYMTCQSNSVMTIACTAITISPISVVSAPTHACASRRGGALPRTATGGRRPTVDNPTYPPSPLGGAV